MNQGKWEPLSPEISVLTTAVSSRPRYFSSCFMQRT